MRLPRPLRRLLDPHTGLITGVKSALRASNQEGIARTVARYRRPLKLSGSEADDLTRILVGRLSDSVSHDEASESLQTIASGLAPQSLHSTTWSALENLSRTIGCFSASLAFTQRAHLAIEKEKSRPRLVLSAIHRRDLDLAIEHFRHYWTWDNDWFDIAHYIWVWSGGISGVKAFDLEPEWAELLTNRPVTILGPAETTLTKKNLKKNSLVARVIMQDVVSWDTASDPLGGQCDLAYASRETRNWLRETGSWDQLADFAVTSLRVDEGSELGASQVPLRRAHDPRRLMLGGSSPNMIPLMAWDVMRVPGVTLTMGGTTFFASQEAYTAGNRRFKHTSGRATDATGSTGELFERCPTFARHNVLENLTLIANWVSQGAVSADRPMARVAALSPEDYMAELDDLYGRDRR